MTLRWLLRIAAIYLGALGAASLLVPQAASSGLGHASTASIYLRREPLERLCSRWRLNWSASMSTVIPVGAVLANVFMNAVLGTVDATNIIGGTIDASSWSGVAIHAALVLAFSLCLFRAIRRHKAAPLA
ncbi:hypothetical protein GCM10011574_43880 [Microbispora bryophytorum]|uniref:Uncharacterized protein n=2 Tax=Microbispora bryophytorum TaxID=1460882 RepID=A0A8H9H4Z2_9ACTN|nr:hypothetical protein GCM10011574_43880 [Microbispora bryophytorum]